jgi:hypothetical protein
VLVLATRLVVLLVLLWGGRLWAGGPSAEPVCPPLAPAPTPAELQDALLRARDRGALWRFEKDGRHGYLYGTLHVGKLDWAMPGRVVDRALRDSDVIVMEADPGDPRFRADMIAPARAHEAPPLEAAMTQRLQAQAAKACVPWERLQAMPPLLIGTTLMLLDARWEGLHVDYASEMVLAGFAKAAGKQIRALETAAVQRAAIASGSAAEQTLAIEGALAGLENGTARAGLVATAKAWATGDLGTLHAQLADPAGRAVLERMVVGRNPAMAAAVAELHRDGRRLFVATGILHMLGEAGLPALLAERGFKVERMPFDSH